MKGTTLAKDQAAAPPAGSVEVRTSPLLSTAMHSEAEGQEAPVIWTEPPPLASLQLAAPPLGLVELRRLPASLPLRQSAAATHDTASRLPGPAGAPTRCQAEASPRGSVEVTMRPSAVTATQRDGELQETPLNSTSSPNSIDCQAEAPPVGSVEVKILPLSTPPWSERLPETATQRLRRRARDSEEMDVAALLVDLGHVSMPRRGPVGLVEE